MTQTVAVHLLKMEDAGAIQRLVSDPAIAATTRIPHPYPENGAREFIAAQLKERAEGRAYVFVIRDREEIVGACGLHGIEGGRARELGYWVGQPYWGRGYATFGVKQTLEFAFQNLRLEHVGSSALESNAASRRVLEKCGFTRPYRQGCVTRNRTTRTRGKPSTARASRFTFWRVDTTFGQPPHFVRSRERRAVLRAKRGDSVRGTVRARLARRSG